MSPVLLEYKELTTGPKPQYSIIWLHGLGADGNDFISLVPALHLTVDCRFIFPHAPMRPITCNQGYIMRGWYDIVYFDAINRQADITGINASRTALHRLIEQENTRGIPTDKIILAGFSQGGAMVYMTGLTYPEPLAGLICLSSYIPAESLLHEEYHAANQRTPLFIGHGIQDPIVKMDLSAQAHSIVSTFGNPSFYRTYPMQHALCPEEVADLSTWLNHIISPAPKL